MKGNTARNHHYIPQCYLRGFTNGGGKKSKLRVLDAKTKKSFESNTKNVGARRDFLKVNIEGTPPDALEVAMSGFEGLLAPTLRSIEAKKSINPEELNIILNFMGLLAIRNPNFREVMRRFVDDISKRILDLSLATKERWEGQVAQMAEKGIDISGMSYEEMKRFAEEKQYELTLSSDFHIYHELNGLDAILPHLFARKWVLVEASEESGPFITTDHPVSLRWKHPEDIPPFYRSSPGYGMRDTQVIFPISKNLVLIGEFEDSEEQGDITSTLAPPELVKAINSLLISTSKGQIYAPSLGFKFAGQDGSTIEGGKLLSHLK